LIDIQSGRIARRLSREGAIDTSSNAGRRAVFSPDGQWLAVFGGEGSTELYHQPGNWELVSRLPGSGTVTHVEFSSDSAHLLAVRDVRDVVVWGLRENRQIGPTLSHDELVYQAHFSPDGRRIATACADNLARIFDFQTGELACKTVTHWVDVFDAVFSFDGRWLFTMGDNSLLGVWSARDGGFVDQISVSIDRSEGPAPLRSASIFAPFPGSTVAVAGRRKQIDLIQLGAFVPDESVTPSKLKLVAELAASARIERGGESPVSTDEWVSLWNEYIQFSADELQRVVDDGPEFKGLRTMLETAVSTPH
jgi:WD40 repeat protein